MSTGIFIFDRQHHGKPNRRDMGAGFDLDGDGKVEYQERETQLTPLYYLPAKKLLESLGHRVVILDSGWYSERHRKANRIAMENPRTPVAYLACHVNAGKGSYAAYIHDSRSRGGARLARVLGNATADAALPKISRVRVVQGTLDERVEAGPRYDQGHLRRTPEHLRRVRGALLH